MINKIKTILITSASALTLLVVPLLAVLPTHAQGTEINTCLSQGSGLNGSLSGDCQQDPKAGSGTDDISGIMTLIVNIISIIVGFVSVVMIIWGGMKYVTSGGESGKITSAKNTIMYALIGLVVVGLAQFIVRFVLKQTTNAVSA